MTNFRLDLVNFENEVLEPDIGAINFQYNRTFGSVGSLVATLPNRYDERMFGRDSMLKLYRTPDNGPTSLEPGAVWFVRNIASHYSDKTVELSCVDQMDLLRRRIVGYRQYTTMADKTFDEGTQGRADDLMRAFVRENLGAYAIVDGTAIPDTERDLSRWLYIGPDEGRGPIIENSSAFQKISDTLDTLRNDAKAAGVDVYYDMRVRSDGSFEFVTPVSSPGSYNEVDINPFEFRAQDGNLANLVVERDYREEVTFVYVTCGGIGIGQHYIKVGSNRADLTPFNRIEEHVGADEFNDSYLVDLANARLEGGKPKVRVSASVIDSPYAVYGKDFNFGDRVLVTAFGMQFDCYINSISNSVSDGKERLEINLEGVVASDPDSVNELEVWSARNYVHSTSVSGYIEIAP